MHYPHGILTLPRCLAQTPGAATHGAAAIQPPRNQFSNGPQKWLAHPPAQPPLLGFPSISMVSLHLPWRRLLVQPLQIDLIYRAGELRSTFNNQQASFDRSSALQQFWRSHQTQPPQKVWRRCWRSHLPTWPFCNRIKIHGHTYIYIYRYT